MIEHLRLMHHVSSNAVDSLERTRTSARGSPGSMVAAKQDGKYAQIEATISDRHYPLQSYQNLRE